MTRCRARCWLPLLLLLAFAGPARAGAAPVAPAGDEVPASEPDVEDVDAGLPDGPEGAALARQLATARGQALIERMRLAQAMDAYQISMYRHHQFWTDAAAVAVYAITAFGLLCAGVQFRLVARMKGMEVHDEAGSAGAVELPGGAKVSSPFLGVILLFLSLGFFYLYLTNVYPILDVAQLEARQAVRPPTPPSPEPPNPGP